MFVEKCFQLIFHLIEEELRFNQQQIFVRLFCPKKFELATGIIRFLFVCLFVRCFQLCRFQRRLTAGIFCMRKIFQRNKETLSISRRPIWTLGSEKKQFTLGRCSQLHSLFVARLDWPGCWLKLCVRLIRNKHFGEEFLILMKLSAALLSLLYCGQHDARLIPCCDNQPLWQIWPTWRFFLFQWKSLAVPSHLIGGQRRNAEEKLNYGEKWTLDMAPLKAVSWISMRKTFKGQMDLGFWSSHPTLLGAILLREWTKFSIVETWPCQ